MNAVQQNQARPVQPVDPAEEARLEAEAVKWCERMGRALNAKKSDYKPKRRGCGNADHS